MIGIIRSETAKNSEWPLSGRLYNTASLVQKPQQISMKLIISCIVYVPVYILSLEIDEMCWGSIRISNDVFRHRYIVNKLHVKNLLILYYKYLENKFNNTGI